MFGENTGRVGIALAVAFAALVGLTLADFSRAQHPVTPPSPAVQTFTPAPTAMVRSVVYSPPAAVQIQPNAGAQSWASASLGPADPAPAAANPTVVRSAEAVQTNYSAQVFLPPLTVYAMPGGSAPAGPITTADYGNVQTAAASQATTDSGQDHWIRLPGAAPLWLTDIHLDSGGFTHNNMPVAGVLSGVRGIWLLDATVYNASPQPARLVPCRLAFEDGSSEPVFTGSGAWVSNISPAQGGGFPGSGFCSPALSNTLAVDLPPHALTTFRLFAENDGALQDNSTSGSGIHLAAARTPVLRPRYPRAIQFIETSPSDTGYQLADDGTMVDRFKHAATLLQSAEKDHTGAILEIPATIETLSRFGQVYPGGVPQ